jgi:hypothetical protein
LISNGDIWGLKSNGTSNPVAADKTKFKLKDNLAWCGRLSFDRLIESLKQWAHRTGVELD